MKTPAHRDHRVSKNVNEHRHGWDAPFWAFLLLGAVSLGSLGCFGVAAAQHAPADIDVLTTDNMPPPSEF